MLSVREALALSQAQQVLLPSQGLMQVVFVASQALRLLASQRE